MQLKDPPKSGSFVKEEWMAKGPSALDSMHGDIDEATQQAQLLNKKNIKISRKDLIYFVGQLAIMFDTGLNIMTALDCLTLEAKNPALRTLVVNVRKSISEGNPLWVAMKKNPKVFSPICVSMVRAGESSGAMGKMLYRLEKFLDTQEDIRKRVRSALSYPVTMLVFSIAVLVFLLSYIFPKFEVMFQDRWEDLPAPTKFFLALSHMCTDYWYIIVPSAIMIIGGSIWCWTRKEFRFHIDGFLLKIPLLGQLLMRMSMSRSLHTLALMLEAGIPVLDALRMAKDVAGNAVFTGTWNQVSLEVENGRDIAGPLKKNPHIPVSEVQMISMGDRSGRLPVVLTKLSDRYESEINISVKNLIQFVEPALVITMGCLVGMIVISLILPIFAMSRGG